MQEYDNAKVEQYHTGQGCYQVESFFTENKTLKEIIIEYLLKKAVPQKNFDPETTK